MAACLLMAGLVVMASPLIPLLVLVRDGFSILLSGCRRRRRESATATIGDVGINKRQADEPRENLVFRGQPWLLNPFFKLGRPENLRLGELPHVHDDDSSDETVDSFSRFLRISTSSKTIPASLSLAKQILEYSRLLKLIISLAGVYLVASLVVPILISHLIDYLSTDRDKTTVSKYAVFCVTLLFGVKNIEWQSSILLEFNASRLRCRVTSCLMKILVNTNVNIPRMRGYLEPSNSQLRDSAGVDIGWNQIKDDVEKIGEFFNVCHGILLFPLQIIFNCMVLCFYLGLIPSAIAVLTTLLVKVATFMLADEQKKLSSKMKEARDARMGYSSNFLKIIEVLKMQSWYPHFHEIQRLRETELKWLKPYLKCFTISKSILWASPTIITVVTYAFCVWVKTPPSTGGIIAALTSIRQLEEASNNLCELISLMMETNTSIDRIAPLVTAETDIEMGEYAPQQLNNNESNETQHSFSLAEGERSDRISDMRNVVKCSVYFSYMTAAWWGVLVLLVLLCQFLFQGLYITSIYLITFSTQGGLGNTSFSMLFSLICLFFTPVSSWFLYLFATKTSQNLFLRTMKSMFRAPTAWSFRSLPNEILRKAPTDISVMDTDIPFKLADLTQSLLALCGVVLLMATAHLLILPLAILVIVICGIYQVYQASTALQLARIEEATTNAIYQHLKQKSCSRLWRPRSREKVITLVDDYARVMHYSSAVKWWLSVRIYAMFNFLVFIVMLLAVFNRSTYILTASLASVLGLDLKPFTAWVGSLSSLHEKMISVHRILQLSRFSPSESAPDFEKSISLRPPSRWPSEGQLNYRDFFIQTPFCSSSSPPMVLKGVICAIPSSKKVWVLGKSTGRASSEASGFAQASFGELESNKGFIFINGSNSSGIAVRDLRSWFGLIPQDPALFENTLRFNLDPLGKYTDREIWKVFNKCQLWKIVGHEFQNCLDAQVLSIGGRNWSVQQRQLICLASVLLYGSRIIVFEEAPQTKDTDTYSLILHIITKEKTRRTVLIVSTHSRDTTTNTTTVAASPEDLVLVFIQGILPDDPAMKSEFVGDSSSGDPKQGLPYWYQQYS